MNLRMSRLLGCAYLELVREIMPLELWDVVRFYQLRTSGMPTAEEESAQRSVVLDYAYHASDAIVFCNYGVQALIPSVGHPYPQLEKIHRAVEAAGQIAQRPVEFSRVELCLRPNLKKLPALPRPIRLLDPVVQTMLINARRQPEDRAVFGIAGDYLDELSAWPLEYDKAELLAHLRWPHRHFRGCWVTDYLFSLR